MVFGGKQEIKKYISSQPMIIDRKELYRVHARFSNFCDCIILRGNRLYISEIIDLNFIRCNYAFSLNKVFLNFGG